MRGTSPTNPEGPTKTVKSRSTFYSLWDIDTGNSLGTYDTEEEVWDVIRALLEEIGPEYADDLDLSLEDEDGAITHIATGSVLLLMAGMSRHAMTN